VLTRDAVACSPVMMAEGKAESVAVGRLLKGLDDRALISMEDEVIVSRDTQASLNPGDRLAVIRPEQRLVDQQTGQPISRALSVLGLVEVKEVRDRVAQGRISYSCGAMTMGDLVIPYVPAQFPEDRVAQPTRRSVEGVVLESSRGERLISQLQIVYLSVGATQGVASGDVFALYRISPPVANVGGAPFAMPPMRLGEAVIIRVADQTATAAVTTSNGGREIRIGDRAVLSRQIAP
jgi:hypothetical protein